MTKYQVIRTHVSPYQDKNFQNMERELIKGLPDLEYRLLTEWENRETILITNTHTKLNELPRDLLKETKLIIHPNSGYDHFKNEHRLWEDIPLVVGHTIRAQAVAEYSIGALFQGLMEIPQHIKWDADRLWQRQLLQGQEVWIFGFGHIGKIIANTLNALGMKITIVDPFIESCPYTHLCDWKIGNIHKARAVIAACSLNPTSEELFNEEFFSSLASEVLFINGARGKLVQEKALREFLLTHPESFAFLDVFQQEPFGEEWIGFPQVWKTSHIAGVEKNLDQKILKFEYNVLQDFINCSQEKFFEKYRKELLQNKWINGVLI